MKTTLIKDNWPERTIRIATGEEIRLTADDPDDVSVIVATNAKNQDIGEIRFSLEQDDFSDEEALLITSLGLDRSGTNYTRQGIGEAMLRMIQENTELRIVARCPYIAMEKEDGSHLTGNGPGFVIKMKELGLVEPVCYDPWCACHDPDAVDEDKW